MTWPVIVPIKKLQVKIIDTIAKGSQFDCLRPKVRIIFKMDSIFDVPQLDIFFDDWYANSVRLWSKTEKARKHFLRIERTPPDTLPTVSDDSNFSSDTVH